MSDLKKCQCGYGDNWYCCGAEYGTHEFNRGENPTARYYADRQPEASVFGHVSGKYAIAHGPEIPEKKFRYTKGVGYMAARKAAIQHVEECIAKADDAAKEEQLGLFGAIA